MDIPRVDLREKKQRRRILLAISRALALLGGVVAVASLKPAAPEVELASLWIDTVRRGEMVRRVRGPGVLVPRETRWIAAPATVTARLPGKAVGSPCRPPHRCGRKTMPELRIDEIVDQLREGGAQARADWLARLPYSPLKAVAASLLQADAPALHVVALAPLAQEY